MPQLLPSLELPLTPPELIPYQTASLKVAETALRSIRDHGSTRLPYHFLEHSQLVIVDGAALGNDAIQNETMGVQDFYDLLMACAGHDVIYYPGGGRSEAHSAGFMYKKILDKFPKPQRESTAQRVSGLIISTTVDLSTPGMILQQVDPNDYCSGLLCDADLAAFGKSFDEYFEQAIRYFRELHINVYDADQRREKFLDFFSSNVAILGGQEFHTAEARARFPQRDKNAEILDLKLQNPTKAFVNLALPPQ